MQKRLPVILSILCLAACAATRGTQRHVVESMSRAWHPTVPDAMNDRIREAAKRYSGRGAVPRVALFDMAFPESDAEFAEMHGHAVLLVVALSHDPGELPPARVFGIGDGVEKPLELIKGETATDDRERVVARLLGRYRWYGLYLLPVSLVRDGGSLAMDFATHRRGFVLGGFSSADTANLGDGHSVSEPTGSAPSPDVVMRLVSREFPGFLRQQ